MFSFLISEPQLLHSIASQLPRVQLHDTCQQCRSKPVIYDILDPWLSLAPRRTPLAPPQPLLTQQLIILPNEKLTTNVAFASYPPCQGRESLKLNPSTPSLSRSHLYCAHCISVKPSQSCLEPVRNHREAPPGKKAVQDSVEGVPRRLRLPRRSALSKLTTICLTMRMQTRR